MNADHAPCRKPRVLVVDDDGELLNALASSFQIAELDGSFAEEGVTEYLVIRVGTPLGAAEDLLIRAALRHTRGDKQKAARMLGVSARTLYRRAQSPASRDRPARGS